MNKLENETGPDSDSGPFPAADGPRSVLRVLSLLKHIAEKSEGMSLSLLGQRLQAPKSSLSNLLRALESGNYVTNHGGTFTLAEESFRLAAIINRGNNLPDFARSVLVDLTATTGETSVLGVLSSDDRVVFVDRVISPQTLAVNTQIGEWRNLHDSASGRAILSMLPEDRLRAYISRPDLTRRTELTEIRPDKLIQILKKVREDGIAITNGESDIGLAGIAAPILNSANHPIGSLVVSGPSERVKPRIEEWSILVRAAAKVLSGASWDQWKSNQ